MTQRAMAVTELRTFAGLEIGETAAAQCRPSRIKKDNQHMKALSEKIDEFCNPFDPEAPGSFVNFATGRAAAKETETYLLATLERGQTVRKKFSDEWKKTEPTRFLRAVKKIKVSNFAAENNKKKKKGKTPAAENAQRSAESLRDFFIRMIVVVAESTTLDLGHVLKYPITSYPLSLAHVDGGLLKTAKSALLNKMEEHQTEKLTEISDDGTARIYDGGLVIHSVLSTTNIGASYGSIARRIMSMICSGQGAEVHICLDKYVENSIKDSERKLRGAEDATYTITGAEQTIRQKGENLLSNGMLKNELGRFLLKEWEKNHYNSVLNGKVLYASFGGECFQYTPTNGCQEITMTTPAYLQADHEEADTLIAFHLINITASKVLVRASDTDVLVILVGMLGNQRREVRSMKTVIMDYGSGNSRRFINVSNIVEIFEERKPGLPRALPGYHAFTGCDFTAPF